jgi:hypothetical protein
MTRGAAGRRNCGKTNCRTSGRSTSVASASNRLLQPCSPARAYPPRPRRDHLGRVRNRVTGGAAHRGKGDGAPSRLVSSTIQSVPLSSGGGGRPGGVRRKESREGRLAATDVGVRQAVSVPYRGAVRSASRVCEHRSVVRPVRDCREGQAPPRADQRNEALAPRGRLALSSAHFILTVRTPREKRPSPSVCSAPRQPQGPCTALSPTDPPSDPLPG